MVRPRLLGVGTGAASQLIMPRAEPPRWTPGCRPAAASDRPPPSRDLGFTPTEPAGEDTLAVPLATAETLPCPRLLLAEPPTLRATPGELAELIELTRPPPPQPAVAPPAPLQLGRRRLPPVRQPDLRPPLRLPPPALGNPPVRQPDSGQTERLRLAVPGYTGPLSWRAGAAPTLQPGSSRPALPAGSARAGESLPQRQEAAHQAERRARAAQRPVRPPPRQLTASPGRTAAAPPRPLGSGTAMMPTQLWLGSMAAGATLQRPRSGFWTRLWRLLALAVRPRRRPGAARPRALPR